MQCIIDYFKRGVGIGICFLSGTHSPNLCIIYNLSMKAMYCIIHFILGTRFA